jgi:N-acetylglucosamine kinase-like BadF-type ATPase
MPAYYLGVDVGSSKTHALITDTEGRPIGFGAGGPGNHEVVDYAGLVEALRTAVGQALSAGGLAITQIRGAGFGVSGYDWPSEREPTLQAIATLGLDAPYEAVNDTILGLLAGAAQGWGISVVSGTGCNCRGWDREGREGRVTGMSYEWGEGAGASELMVKARQALAYEWSRRGHTTQLTPAFLKYTGSNTLDELLEGLMLGSKSLSSQAAPLVFQVARGGDPVAIELIRWAGQELGELANCVIRQLGFERMNFDVILMGSMFDGGPLLIEPMRQTIHTCAPGARLKRLMALPVTGAVLLGMQAAGIKPSRAVRQSMGKLSDLEIWGVPSSDV